MFDANLAQFIERENERLSTHRKRKSKLKRNKTKARTPRQPSMISNPSPSVLHSSNDLNRLNPSASKSSLMSNTQNNPPSTTLPTATRNSSKPTANKRSKDPFTAGLITPVSSTTYSTSAIASSTSTNEMMNIHFHRRLVFEITLRPERNLYSYL